MIKTTLPPLKSLRYFRVSGRHLSFKDAAEELCVTPSAVSHQIRNLESALGLRLFERRTRSLEFTAAGARYFRVLDNLFARLESETDQLRAEFGRSVLRLNVPPFLASEMLLPKMGALQQCLPDTDIRITTQPSRMKDHPAEADVSILLDRTPDKRLLTHRLFERRLVAACSPAYRKKNPVRTFEELDGQLLIAHENRPDAWDDFARSLGARPPRARNILRFDSMSDVVRAAGQGLGIALVSWPLGRWRFEAGELVRALDHEMDTGERFHLACRPDDAERADVAQLVGWLLHSFRDDG